jgi:hypothetical protein
MTTLTYSSGRIHLGVGAFILSLILSGFSMGCEDAADGEDKNCIEEFLDCDDLFSPVGVNQYCTEQAPQLEPVWESCEDFRRGQMCQCLSDECKVELQETIKMHHDEESGFWVYNNEFEESIGELRCPVFYDDY